jgi:flagellar biosynthetic protein FliP
VRFLALALSSVIILPAQTSPPMGGIRLGSGAGNGSLSAPLQIVLLLTALTLLPAILVSITPFLRIVVVLHFLRQALGTQSTPSNQILIGLSLFLALLIMQPVGMDIYNNALQPMDSGKITPAQAWEAGTQPMKNFLSRFAREKDVQLMLEITHSPSPKSPEDLDLRVLVPAYILSELKAAFQIGAVLYLPFLVIDLLVASVTLSLGMVQLPPVMISAPFKLMLFVLVDGWTLVVGSLLRSFHA